MAWLFSKITQQSPTLTKESVQSALGQHHYSNQKSIDTFNFKYTPIEQTIQETAVQFKEAKSNGLAAKILPLN